MRMVIVNVPNRMVFHRSCFEIDLNRDRDGAVYLTPVQAQGVVRAATNRSLRGLLSGA